MDVTVTGQSEVTINGEIKTVNDYLAIKQTMLSLVEDGTEAIAVKIISSSLITSALIGFFLRLVHENNIKLTVYVGNERLLKMFEVMKLINTFDVKPL